MLSLTQWMSVVDPQIQFSQAQKDAGLGYWEGMFKDCNDPLYAQVEFAKNDFLYCLGTRPLSVSNFNALANSFFGLMFLNYPSFHDYGIYTNNSSLWNGSYTPTILANPKDVGFPGWPF